MKKQNSLITLIVSVSLVLLSSINVSCRNESDELREQLDEQIRLNRKLQKEIDELREEMDYSSYSYEDYLSNKQQFEEHMRKESEILRRKSLGIGTEPRTQFDRWDEEARESRRNGQPITLSR
ncbi:MAG: hypothetical protein IKH97_07435 [Bacteroidales bacterium]|nr:hypothetical protein [Bacteroidales bacterium]